MGASSIVKFTNHIGQLYQEDLLISAARMAAPMAGKCVHQFVKVRAPSMAQARQPLEPAWPKDAGAASVGAKWGSFCQMSVGYGRL